MTEERPTCEFCPEPADFKEFPMVVHGRLYEGDLCEYHAFADLNGGVGGTDKALSRLQECFTTGSLEYRCLEELKGTTFERY